MASSYTASDIEVLSGLDPVRRRPGMYTDTTRPNHLAHEVIDNSVDEALAGYCQNIHVTVFKDGSCEVVDDGRGLRDKIGNGVGLTNLRERLQALYAASARFALEEVSPHGARATIEIPFDDHAH